jgi:hypothetical protein
MRCAVLAIAFAAAGCAAPGSEMRGSETSHEKVAGWPVLRVYEHYVPHAMMEARCARYVARYGARALACAEFNLSEGRCDIWYSRELGRRPDLVLHEWLHCAGYDHPGENAMAKTLAAWKARGVKATSTPEPAANVALTPVGSWRGASTRR